MVARRLPIHATPQRFCDDRRLCPSASVSAVSNGLGLCELSMRTDQVVAIRELPQKGPDLRLPGFC